MLYRRYEGSFLSRAGVTWTVRILQEAEQAFDTIGELDFPADDAVIIEWSQEDKEKPMCGSVATITLISPGDRTYEDLYTIEPGRIRADILKNGVIYWSGCLDPEFYTEPYSSGMNYLVSLSFSDFGILHRLNYNLSGMKTLEEVLLDALTRSKINYLSVNQGYISTRVSDVLTLRMNRLSVRSDNFFDEDGVPMDLYSVLEGIFQPLALKCVQRNGVIYIYDINGLYAGAAGSPIVWVSDDQALGVDKVANNAKITLSTYGQPDLQPEFEYTDETDETVTNLTSDVPETGPECYSYYQNYEEGRVGSDWDYSWLSFTIFLSQNAAGLAYKHPNAKYFKIVPLLGGNEAEGVAYFFYTGGHGALTTGWPRKKGITYNLADGTPIMRTHKAYLPAVGEEASKLNLRLVLPMLLDPRYNPFSDAETGNEKDNYGSFGLAQDALVPVMVQLYNEAGDVIMHYTNRTASEYQIGYDMIFGKATKYSTKGGWESGPAAHGDCMLQYYDPKDKRAGRAVCGWQENRQACGFYNKVLYPSFAEQDPGQVIPYPPQGGYIEVTVCAGIMLVKEALFGGDMDMTSLLMPVTRWLLFQAPKLELLRAGTTNPVVNSDDVEYTGELNASAKEGIEIDTICGTMETPSPIARGLFFDSTTKAPITALIRQGRMATAEQLLIGTLYSQYASRKTTLSGKAAIRSGGLARLSDAAQGDKRFMLLSDYQNLIMDESELMVAEIAPDEYISDNE